MLARLLSICCRVLCKICRKRRVLFVILRKINMSFKRVWAVGPQMIIEKNFSEIEAPIH